MELHTSVKRATNMTNNITPLQALYHPEHGGKHRVVVVGAGFGGLAVAAGLESVDAEVTLVDQRNHHTFQPLLYQVATAGLDANDISYPTRRIARDKPNLNAVQGEVIGVDFEGNAVILSDGRRVDFDSLVLALGGITAHFGVPGVAEHAFGLKSAADAVTLRDRVLRSFDQMATELQQGMAHRPEATTIVIVGGGPTGVELAGGFSELTTRVLGLDYPEIDQDAIRIVLVEGQGAVLGGFAERLQNNARQTLEGMGVELMLNTQVASVTSTCVELDNGQSVAADTVVWAAGIRAHPLAEQIGLETGRGGRVIVNPDLTIPGHDNVYAIGDFAAVEGEEGLLPQVAPAAIQAGEYVADQIAGRISRSVSSPAPFSYRNKGSMATIGRHAAVVELPNGRTVKGFMGWVAWLGLHLVMLVGFGNRVTVLVKWAWNYLTYDRGSRALIEAPATPELESGSDR